MLVDPGFLARAAADFADSDVDYFFPFTAIDYLDEAATRAVLAGQPLPEPVTPLNTLWPWQGGAPGGMGMVRPAFLARHGGMIEGFRGWGVEDLAWLHKVGVLGRIGMTQRQDQRIHHLFHADSGSISLAANQAAALRNPMFAANLRLYHDIGAIGCAETMSRRFPPAPPRLPWPPGFRIAFVAVTPAARARAQQVADRLHVLFGTAPTLVPAAGALPGCNAAVAFAASLADAAALAVPYGLPWLLAPAAGTSTGEAAASLPAALSEVAILPPHPDAAMAWRAAGLPAWHRAASDDAGAGTVPVLAQPLAHLLGRCRAWRSNIRLDRELVSAAALDRPPFWYVGFHDEDGTELARCDAEATELYQLLRDPDAPILMSRTVVSARPPQRWTVWTLDRHRRWRDHLAGPVVFC
jgi:hypothetical protein